MHVSFHFIIGTPCRYVTFRQGFWWLNQSVWNQTCNTTVSDTPYVLVNSRLTSRPSSFSPGSTSGILFTRYMLRSYGTIPCIHCRIDWSPLYGGRILRMPSIRSKKYFRHLGASPTESTWVQNSSFVLRFKYNRDYDHIPECSSYEILYVGVTLTFQLVLVDAMMDCGPRSCVKFADIFWKILRHIPS
jgi:hypothetical protein